MGCNMVASLNKPDTRSLVLNLLLGVGSAIAMNGLIFGLGWNKRTDSAPKPSFELPDHVVAIVWLVLFAFMATARWLLNSYSEIGALRARASVTFLMIFCLFWPFYSLAIASIVGALVGNFGVIAIALFAIVRLWIFSKTAAFLIMPVVLWVALATTTIFLSGLIRL